MNALELKNKIIREIDSMNEADFEKVYNQLLDVLKSASPHKLSREENEAIDAALNESRQGKSFSHEDVVNEASVRFPYLKFK